MSNPDAPAKTEPEPGPFGRYGPLIKCLVVITVGLVTLWLFSPLTPFPVIPQATIDHCDQAKFAAAIDRIEADKSARFASFEELEKLEKLDERGDPEGLSRYQGQLADDLRDAINDACRLPPLHIFTRLEYVRWIHNSKKTHEDLPARNHLAGFQMKREYARYCGDPDAYGTILDADNRVAAAREMCSREVHFFTLEMLTELYLLDNGIDPELAVRAISLIWVGYDNMRELPGDGELLAPQ